MLTHITINLSEPICNCKEEKLAWQVDYPLNDNKLGLIIFCETCKTHLVVPVHHNLKADFKFKIPYPSTPKIISNNQSNVIPLKPEKKDNDS